MRKIKAIIVDDLLGAIEAAIPNGNHRNDKRFLALCDRIAGREVELVFEGGDDADSDNNDGFQGLFEAVDRNYWLPESCWRRVEAPLKIEEGEVSGGELKMVDVKVGDRCAMDDFNGEELIYNVIGRFEVSKGELVFLWLIIENFGCYDGYDCFCVVEQRPSGFACDLVDERSSLDVSSLRLLSSERKVD